MTMKAKDEAAHRSLDMAKLPTNLTTRNHAVHRWFNFIAGFSPEFVEECIQKAGLQRGATLLDPFAGLATSLVAANAMGLDAVGYETHPFFVDMAQAKLHARELSQLDEVYELLSRASSNGIDLEDEWSATALTYLTKLIEPAELATLADARRRLESCSEASRQLYRLVLSSMLEYAAGSATDGIYKAPTTKKRAIGYQAALERATTMISTDLSWSDFSGDGKSALHYQTSERMIHTSDESIDVCVTSPPYLNNFDFAEMTRMELYFWKYASSWGEITSNVRANQIVNTCTAPTPLKNDRDRWLAALSDAFTPKANALSDELQAAKKGKGGSKDYFKLVHPYFAQMSAVIQEVWRTLKPEGSFHLVVADAALYGVHIHTESLLADLMSEAGFSVKSIERLRSRGDRWVLAKRQGPSGAPLGEFHIHAVKDALAE